MVAVMIIFIMLNSNCHLSITVIIIIRYAVVVSMLQPLRPLARCIHGEGGGSDD